MASSRFFGYDPYDYYYTAPPSQYAYYPYFHRQRQHPPAARSVGGFFPAAETPAMRPRPAADEAAANPKPRARTVTIPVHFVGSDSNPEPAPAVTDKKRARSVDESGAAVRVQAAARGFLARKAVRTLRAVERDAEDVAEKVARDAEALRGDARARVAVGEALMRLLLRLDAVRGAREYRRRVARRVLALQDAVDALEPRPEPAATEGEVASEAAAAEVQVADESDMAPGSTEHGCETGSKVPDTEMEMEVDGDGDGDITADEPCEAGETERLANGADHGGNVSGSADAEEGEWEMVTEEAEPAAEAEAPVDPPCQEPAGEVEGAGGCSDGGLDAKKVMDMVAALCERSAQQCAVIGELARRVDTLERAVHRVEDAERRRRRAKKLRKEGKGSNRNNCYMD